MKLIENYIDGRSTSYSQERLPVHDPSTGEKIAEVSLSNHDDFKAAIKSSKQSQINW